MIALLTSFLGVFGSGLGSALSWVVSWFQAEQAAQTAADNAEQASELSHQNDGAQSVADRDSTDVQNSALNSVEASLDAPPSAPVVGKS